MPGLVSTLLKYTYSVPGRLVHTCLQVTEHVWQPMHLSRFITIATWAMTLTGPLRRAALELHLLRAAPDDGDLVALVAGRAVVVERVAELAVPDRKSTRLNSSHIPLSR